jgi:hypothetical protein
MSAKLLMMGDLLKGNMLILAKRIDDKKIKLVKRLGAWISPVK